MAVLARNTITLAFVTDVASVKWYYCLQASTASQPDQPNTNPPSSIWSETEPGYTEGSTNSLYVCQLTEFSDGTWAYSAVSLSSSYEAAKLAYNQAVAAKNAVDNMEIGGRNLILDTGREFTSAISASGSAYIPAMLFSDFGTRLYKGNTEDNLTISYDYEVHGADAYGTSTPRLYSQFNASSVSSSFVYLSSAEETGHACNVVKMSATQAGLSYDPFRFRIRLQNAADGAYCIIRNLKVESGNKATTWTPAPEDTQSAIDSIDAKTVEYIVGTQTAATGSWTGVTKDASLVAGKTIAYKLPYAGSGNASLTLTLADGTTTDAIPVYSNTTRVTTHFGANSVITMTYDGTYWRAAGAAPSNTNYYDRTAYKASLTAAQAITAGCIAVMNASGQLILLSTTPFDITGPILYVGTAYATGAMTQTNNYTMWGTPFSLANTKSGFVGVAGKPVYIKGTLSGKMFTPDDEVFTCTEPTSEDGKCYILLGTMSTTTNAVLNAEHPIYRYSNGSFKSNTQIASEAATTAQSAETKVTAVYGTCGTAAGTAAKVVTLSGFTLFNGATITVNFTTANTAAAPTLNVNGTGAKPIYFMGANAGSTNQFLWGQGATITFTYNGSGWVPVGHPCSYNGTSSTPVATVAKTSTITGAVICKGTVVNITFANTTNAASPTLNISGTGAKQIIANGSQISSSTVYNWAAGSTVEFTFNGSQWIMASAFSQEEVFNRLTNNGVAQGIYMEEVAGVTQLYINMSYLKTGILRVGGQAVESVLFDGSVTFVNSGGYDSKTLGPFYLVNGQAYKVVFDGTEYNFTCEYDDVDDTYYIGDGWLISDDPTPPPSFVIYNDEGVRIKCTIAGTHTVKLITYEEKDTFYANSITGEVKVAGVLESINGNYEVEIKNALLNLSYAGSKIGSIGVGTFQYRPNNRGVTFDVEPSADYMAWRTRDSNGWYYIMVWTRITLGSFTSNYLTFPNTIGLANKAERYVYAPTRTVNRYGYRAYTGPITINGVSLQIDEGMIFYGSV